MMKDLRWKSPLGMDGDPEIGGGEDVSDQI